MKHTLIISGGNIQTDFASSYVKKNMPAEGYQAVIAVDRGVECMEELGLAPTHIVGDFDSVSERKLLEYRHQKQAQIRAFQPEKDDTDTQIAIKLAVELESERVSILGGTGSRIDHLLGNIQSMHIAACRGIDCRMTDANNEIRLLLGDTLLKRKEQFGTYVSLLSLSSQVTGLTLTGFKYPLHRHTLVNTRSLGVSNEIAEETAKIAFDDGILICIQSKD